jgi:hypothetical protein
MWQGSTDIFVGVSLTNAYLSRLVFTTDYRNTDKEKGF